MLQKHSSRNMNENYHNLLRYMLTAARTNLAQCWKRETLLTISDCESKIGEYAAVAKLNTHRYTNTVVTIFSQLLRVVCVNRPQQSAGVNGRELIPFVDFSPFSPPFLSLELFHLAFELSHQWGPLQRCVLLCSDSLTYTSTSQHSCQGKVEQNAWNQSILKMYTM